MSQPPARISPARTAAEIDAVRALWRLYEAEIDESLEHQGFDEELRTLPGVYAPPTGALLLAWGDGATPAGTAALRPLPARGKCELKRMVVRPEARGRGVGRALVEAIVQCARERYTAIKLDTSSRWTAANALYRACGFTECARYNDDPHPDTVFMERRL